MGWDGKYQDRIASMDVYVWKVFLSIKKNNQIIELEKYGDL